MSICVHYFISSSTIIIVATNSGYRWLLLNATRYTDALLTQDGQALFVYRVGQMVEGGGQING